MKLNKNGYVCRVFVSCFPFTSFVILISLIFKTFSQVFVLLKEMRSVGMITSNRTLNYHIYICYRIILVHV